MKSLHKLGRKKYILLGLALLLVCTLSSAAVTSMLTVKNESFSGIRIYLSPSNQSANEYASGDTTEMEQCDKIAAAAAQELERYGFTVAVGESGASIESRCVESDAFGADMHVPIHTNAYDGEYTGGTRVYVYSANELTAAEYMLDEVGSISPGEDDKVEYMPSLYEVNMPAAETVYVECEFHDTVDGAEWIINNTDKIGKAVAKGIYDYYSSKEEYQ